MERPETQAEEGTEEGRAEEPGRAGDDYEPSQQWLIWAIMFGVLILAVVLTL